MFPASGWQMRQGALACQMTLQMVIGVQWALRSELDGLQKIQKPRRTLTGPIPELFPSWNGRFDLGLSERSQERLPF